MSSTFGAPIQGTTAADDPSQVPSTEPQEMLDPNDPRLISESIEMNLDADAYAQPVPPPDGKYRAKLKLAGPKNDKGEVQDYKTAMWGKPGNKLPIYVTGVVAEIIDPNGKFDGIKIFDFNVATFRNREGASKVGTIVAMLRKPDGSPWVTAAESKSMNQKDWIDRLVKALAGEPEVKVETQWEWSCEGCGKEAKEKETPYPKAIVGMQRFPTVLREGKQVYDPEMKCAVNPAHGYTRCRVTMARVMSVDSK